MSWGKVYETSNWGNVQSFIHIGFNKVLAFISEQVDIFISSINLNISTILESIDRTNY